MINGVSVNIDNRNIGTNSLRKKDTVNYEIMHGTDLIAEINSRGEALRKKIENNLEKFDY